MITIERPIKYFFFCKLKCNIISKKKKKKQFIYIEYFELRP